MDRGSGGCNYFRYGFTNLPDFCRSAKWKGAKCSGEGIEVIGGDWHRLVRVEVMKWC